MPLPMPFPLRRALRKCRLAYHGYRAGKAYGKNTFLLVFGAMRCGSTLLTHLLVNNPRVTGIGETWTVYRDAGDIRTAMTRVFARNRARRTKDVIVMDKLLHDHLVEDTAVLKESHLKCIFMLRDPLGTIRSIHRGKGDFFGLESFSQIASYHVRRTRTLVEYARAVGDPGRAACLTYDELVSEPQPVLRGLRDFLALEDELEPRYDIQWFTGVPRLGDFTPKIHSGRVDATPSEYDVDVPAHDLARCREAHERALTELRHLTTPIPDTRTATHGHSDSR